MNIVDAVIILLLLLGCVAGYKKGFIKSMVTLVGTIVVIVLSYYFKAPIATFLLKYMPFFNFSGIFEGISAINILVYEAVSFLIVFVILYCILGIIINVTGIIEKILNATIVLGIFSKILGAISGLLEMLCFVFILLFVLIQFNVTSEYITDSKAGMIILNNTPVLTNTCAPMIASVEEIINLINDSKDMDKESLNVLAVSKLYQQGVISDSDYNMLVKADKLNLENAVIKLGGN